ncbi:MAG: YggS family pyridoxal phosphate-dependent enzyme [Bacteroidales bacterium]|nr:YggS family pyridoxal phosphate-dependent enzyme [Bacteroidales bacterium]
MPDIASNIISLKQQIPSYVRLVTVSKTKPVDNILAAYNTGHKIFGENRVQELLSKKDLLPADIEWHLIGHLQSNKVKYIVPFISMIESVDTFSLLNIINSEALKINRRIDCLLQFHIASEETKYGFSMNEVIEMTGSAEFRQLKLVRLCGVMGMATFTDNSEQIRKEFRYLNGCFKELKTRIFAEEPSFSEVSMGMSGDYKIALEEGSTIVRIGSIIFGERK